MDEAEVKEMKDSLQQKVTATEVKVAIATAKKDPGPVLPPHPST